MGLSRQLRKAFPRKEQYFGTPLEEFLITLFMRLVMTSTQVELQFSKYTALTDTKTKRLGLHGLAGKAMSLGFTKLVKQWREDQLSGEIQIHNFCSRPAWAKPGRGSKTSALHIYTSDHHKIMKQQGELELLDYFEALKVARASAIDNWPLESEDKHAENEAKAKQSRDEAILRKKKHWSCCRTGRNQRTAH